MPAIIRDGDARAAILGAPGAELRHVQKPHSGQADIVERVPVELFLVGPPSQHSADEREQL